MSYEVDLKESTQRDQISANCKCVPEIPTADLDKDFWKPHFKKEERSRCENKCEKLMGFGCETFTTKSRQQLHCCQPPDTAVRDANDCAFAPKKLTRSGFENQKQCTNQCQALMQYDKYDNKITEFECKGKVRNDARWFLLFLLLRIRASI